MMILRRLFLAFSPAILLVTAAFAQTAPKIDAYALTPPMGWNSWNKFACNVDEKLIRETADAMASSGMKDAGYQFVVIDDCWQVSRDKSGNIVADPERFPSGIKALADYVHSKGLKFGIYTDIGTKTCAGRPGSHDHEKQDAAQYAAWGVDYVKVDWCHTEGQDARSSYQTMRDALDASGRQIVFSICEWGKNEPWKWAHGIGNLWRTTGDISDHFAGQQKWPDGSCCSNGMLAIVDQQVGLEPFAGPGHWNDPDMLEVGNGGMTDVEYRTHFSMWAMLAAPLIAGNDLRSMSDATKDILTNKDVIAIDQDELGKEGHRARKDGDLEVWTRELSNGSRAAALLNRSDREQEITLKWSDLGLQAQQAATIRDLWSHKEQRGIAGHYTVKVPSHGTVMLRVTP